MRGLIRPGYSAQAFWMRMEKQKRNFWHGIIFVNPTPERPSDIMNLVIIVCWWWTEGRKIQEGCFWTKWHNCLKNWDAKRPTIWMADTVPLWRWEAVWLIIHTNRNTPSRMEFLLWREWNENTKMDQDHIKSYLHSLQRGPVGSTGVGLV